MLYIYNSDNLSTHVYLQATSIHASSLFHTEKAKSRRYFSGR